MGVFAIRQLSIDQFVTQLSSQREFTKSLSVMAVDSYCLRLG